MREIKFRLWFENKMILPEHTHGGGGSSSMIYTIDLNGNVDYRNVYGLDTEAVKNCDEAIKMQYTGLKDKNGKEIYEGDVVEAKPFIGDDTIKGTVLMDRGVWWAEEINPKYSEREYLHELTKGGVRMCEIIGNIYENPELLR